METGTKRKSIDDCDVQESKKLCKTSVNKTGDGHTPDNATVGVNIDNTQEYELEDSDGFEFDINTDTLVENGHNGTDNPGEESDATEKAALMRGETEEYTPEYDILTDLKNGENGEKSTTTSSDNAASTSKTVATKEAVVEQSKGIDADGKSDKSKDIDADGKSDKSKDIDADGKSDETEAGTSGVSSPKGESSSEKYDLSKIASVQRDAEMISNIIPDLDMKNLYSKVLQKRKESNRVDIVTNEVLENMSGVGNAADSNDNSSETIFKDVADVIAKIPDADPNKVFDMLEKLDGKLNRVSEVVDKLSGNKNTLPSGDTSLKEKSAADVKTGKQADAFNDPAFKKNPLYGDLKTLRKVLPEKDPNEIYAFLEAHFQKPNRVQIVIDELTKSDSQESIPFVAHESLEEEDKGKAPMTADDRLQHDLKRLKELFTDCDPNFLYEKLDVLPHDGERVAKIAAELFENKQYPKLKDVLEKVDKESRKEKYKKLDFKLEDFLRKFPNPVTYFDDPDRLVNQNYKAHTLVYMKNTYPYLKDGYIRKMLEKHKQHLAPAVEEVEQEMPYIMDSRRSNKKRLTPRDETLEYPDDLEELFFQEIMFCHHRQQIKDHLDEVKRARDLKIANARDTGELHECGCCFDDECLFEEMQACADGHIFCKECILRSSEAAIGEGRTKFPCLTGTCEQEFPLRVLQGILSPTLFSLALRKMQEEELRQADIPDLVSCPFCSFATVMPNQEDKVFKCLNPDCLRESCRLCKEPNHVPLRCNEVEKQGETNMRTFIETKMSEAMLRTCPSCKKRFYKESGCNKMTCTCGTTMCYICREGNIDYEHFNDGKCSIDSDIFTMHKDEMLAAAEKAKQEYMADHPEQQEDLKYDPLKLLEKMKNRWGNDGVDNDDDDGYDDDEDDDYDD